MSSILYPILGIAVDVLPDLNGLVLLQGLKRKDEQKIEIGDLGCIEGGKKGLGTLLGHFFFILVEIIERILIIEGFVN